MQWFKDHPLEIMQVVRLVLVHQEKVEQQEEHQEVEEQHQEVEKLHQEVEQQHQEVEELMLQNVRRWRKTSKISSLVCRGLCRSCCAGQFDHSDQHGAGSCTRKS